MIFFYAVRFVDLLVWALMLAFMLRAILSWFAAGSLENPIMRFLVEVTEPIVGPLRRVIPPVGPLDLSFFVAMILIQVVGGLLKSVLIQAALSS